MYFKDYLLHQDARLRNPVIALKSVVFFEDINFDEPIKMAGETKFQWKKIERRLTDMVKSSDEVYPQMPIHNHRTNNLHQQSTISSEFVL
jgi:hypothetical protein